MNASRSWGVVILRADTRSRVERTIAATAMLLVVCVAALLAVQPTMAAQSAVVQSKSGPLRGVLLDGSPKVTAYLGVPYGAPTDGERRFAAPTPVAKWTETRLFDKLASTCFYTLDTYFPAFAGAEMWNGNTELSEDCLNLNMWVPSVGGGGGALPVLVWIYGGGFFSGSPSLELYDGSTLARESGFIVVNINYRLGPFGFLYLGAGSAAGGNAGLLDQQLALKWVAENMGAFGGDPRRVTLVGESAGAASVTAHMLAPGSWPFFRNAILQSGTVFNRWALTTPEQMLARSVNLAKRVDCHSDDAEMTLKCMRSRQTIAIQQQADMVEVPFMQFPFVPMDDDGRFFKRPVDVALQRGHVKHCAVLLGTNADEGSYWLPYYLGDAFPFNESLAADDVANQALIDWSQYNDSMQTMFGQHVQSAPFVDAAAYRYSAAARSLPTPPQEEPLRTALRDGVSDALADFFFNCDILRFAETLRDRRLPVFMYHFTQRSSANPWPKWMGVMHGYEIEYVFGVPIRSPSNYTPTEVEFSRRIIRDWTHFADHGHAQPPGDWPTYSLAKEYVLLDSKQKEKSVHYDLLGEKCRFWHDVDAIVKLSSDETNAQAKSVAILTLSLCGIAVNLFSIHLFISG